MLDQATGPMQNRKNPRALPGVGALLAVSSAKGGVGKSTVTVNLALALAAKGRKVGILDADILGPSIPAMLGIAADSPPQPGQDGKVTPPAAHGIKVMSMAMFGGDDQPMLLRGPMIGKYLGLFLTGVDWGDLDLLLLDMPPGTGDIQLTIAQTFPLDGAVVVTTPQAVSTRIARRGARMFEKVQTPVLGVVENMRTFTCPACGTTTDLFGHGGGERLASDLGLAFLGALPLDPAVLAAGDDGRPLGESAIESAAAYRELATRVEHALDTAKATIPSFRWRWTDDASAPGWDDCAVEADGAPDVPVGIRRGDKRTLSILWQDGVRSDLDVRDLRLACGCAHCREEISGRALLDPESVAETIRPIDLWNVGNYALGIRWSDGHDSGIYPFERLRRLGGN